jgi:hypothetical protein
MHEYVNKGIPSCKHRAIKGKEISAKGHFFLVNIY